MAPKLLRLLLTLLLAGSRAVAWAAAPADSLRRRGDYYKLGKALGRGLFENHRGELLADTIPVMVLVAIVSALLDMPTRLPRWHRWLRWLWVPAVLGFIVSVNQHYKSPLLSEGYLLFAYGVLALLLWQQRQHRPAATALWALALLVLRRLASLGLHLTGYELLPPFTSFYKLWGVLNLPLFFGLIAVAFYYKKSLQKAAAEQAEAEQQRQAIAARNAELERLVTERTATLTQQADELHAALAELRTTQQQLIQSEKMASLGELTAGIAHEIQNPLNFVNNFADVSAELVAELEEEQRHPAPDAGLEGELLADLKHNLHKINLHGQRASSIVRGMLAHSRQSTGERQPTDLSALCDEYLRLAYHGLRAKDKTFNARLDTDFAADLPRVEAVPGDLGRVLLNLFTNAFYAVQKRQQTGEPGYQPTVHASTRRYGSEAVITVRDNGTGIPEAVRQKIFQPFFTTKPSGEGTGLGLSLAHDIVVQGHSGTLEVDSREGEFTEFRVRLPLAATNTVRDGK